MLILSFKKKKGLLPSQPEKTMALTSRPCRKVHSAVQNLHECLTKLHVESGVYDGVHSTVHVSQPREGVVHFQRHIATSTVGLQDVSDEKGQPAYNENTWKRKTLAWNTNKSPLFILRWSQWNKLSAPDFMQTVQAFLLTENIFTFRYSDTKHTYPISQSGDNL